LRDFISEEQTKENDENVGLAVNNLWLKLVSTGGKVVPQAQYVGRNNRIIVLFVP
jgi:hypothetical protein